MTISQLEDRLKSIDSRLSVRMRGPHDVGGIFLGSKYLLRLTKGELNLNGYRYMTYTSDMKWIQGNIMKRGRKTIVKLLQIYVPMTLEQRASILWGI